MLWVRFGSKFSPLKGCSVQSCYLQGNTFTTMVIPLPISQHYYPYVISVTFITTLLLSHNPCCTCVIPVTPFVIPATLRSSLSLWSSMYRLFHLLTLMSFLLSFMPSLLLIYHPCYSYAIVVTLTSSLLIARHRCYSNINPSIRFSVVIVRNIVPVILTTALLRWRQPIYSSCYPEWQLCYPYGSVVTLMSTLRNKKNPFTVSNRQLFKSSALKQFHTDCLEFVFKWSTQKVTHHP